MYTNITFGKLVYVYTVFRIVPFQELEYILTALPQLPSGI